MIDSLFEHNYIGETYNGWEILCESKEPNYYYCKCINCGSIKKIYITNIIKKNKYKYRICNKCKKIEEIKSKYVGKEFNLLTVVDVFLKNNEITCLCKCKCKNMIEVKLCDLKRNRIKSCGCKKGKKINNYINDRFYNNTLKKWIFNGKIFKNKNELIDYLKENNFYDELREN